MTKVRYTNKKTGRVNVYESISHYDPITKSSRPKRIYLGYEDPVTKEIIPSSGERGRPPKAEKPAVNYDEVTSELRKQRKKNREMEIQIQTMTARLNEITRAAEKLITAIHKVKPD